MDINKEDDSTKGLKLPRLPDRIQTEDEGLEVSDTQARKERILNELTDEVQQSLESLWKSDSKRYTDENQNLNQGGVRNKESTVPLQSDLSSNFMSKEDDTNHHRKQTMIDGRLLPNIEDNFVDDSIRQIGKDRSSLVEVNKKISKIIANENDCVNDEDENECKDLFDNGATFDPGLKQATNTDDIFDEQHLGRNTFPQIERSNTFPSNVNLKVKTSSNVKKDSGFGNNFQVKDKTLTNSGAERTALGTKIVETHEINRDPTDSKGATSISKQLFCSVNRVNLTFTDTHRTPRKVHKPKIGGRNVSRQHLMKESINNDCRKEQENIFSIKCVNSEKVCESTRDIHTANNQDIVDKTERNFLVKVPMTCQEFTGPESVTLSFESRRIDAHFLRMNKNIGTPRLDTRRVFPRHTGAPSGAYGNSRPIPIGTPRLLYTDMSDLDLLPKCYRCPVLASADSLGNNTYR